MLTREQITTLVKQQPITDEWPWSTQDEATINHYYTDVIADVRQNVQLLDKTDFEHYDSGYASFIDCWLYREDEEFRFASGNSYWGLVVLFSRLSNYYVVGEGQLSWRTTDASSYLPSFVMVDKISHRAVQSIIDDVCEVLDAHGLVRLRAEELSEPLPDEIRVRTILSRHPRRHFDALFYWFD